LIPLATPTGVAFTVNLSVLWASGGSYPAGGASTPYTTLTLALFAYAEKQAKILFRLIFYEKKILF
jgi:hypothetical protein